MPIVLTETAKSLASQTNIQVNIILEIDGFDYKFGAIPIQEDLLFDVSEATFDSGLEFDTITGDPDSRAWINLDGTTKTYTSQLNIDKGIEAVRSFTIDLLDKDGELSEIFTPGHTVDDVLGQKAKVYLNLINDFNVDVELPLLSTEKSENNFWVFGVVLKKTRIRDEIIEFMYKHGIETRPFFYPLHKQPAFLKMSSESFNCPISEEIGQKGFYIPIGSHVTINQQKMIVDKIVNLLKR